MRRLRLLSLAVVLATCAAQVPAAAQTPSRGKLQKARKVLEQVKLVDGNGSGLNADTVRGVTPIVVVDSTGTLVGTVLELDRTQLGAYIVRRIDATPILIHVTASGFNDTDVGAEAMYESADCSGPPLVFPDVTSGFYPSRAVVVGTTAFYSRAAATTRAIQSKVQACHSPVGPHETPLPNGGCCTADGPYTAPLLEAVEFDLTTLGLTPPFRMDTP